MSRLAGFRLSSFDLRAIRRKPERDRARQFSDRAPSALAIEGKAADHQRDPWTVRLQLRVDRDRPRVDLERTRSVSADARQEAIARLFHETRIGRRLEPDGERPRHVDDERVGRTTAAPAHDLHAARRLHLIDRSDRGRRGFLGARSSVGRRKLSRRDIDFRHRERFAAGRIVAGRKPDEADRRGKGGDPCERAPSDPPPVRRRRGLRSGNEPERFVHFVPHRRHRPSLAR